MEERRQRTRNQQELDERIERFRRRSRLNVQVLDWLQRDEVQIVRAESSAQGRWALYLVLPSYMQQMFDVDLEVLCLVTDYDRVQPRILSELQRAQRANARVDDEVALLVSADPRAHRLVRQRPGGSAIVTLTGQDLVQGGALTVRQALADTLLTIDHFNVTTPIVEPSAFFGRQHDLAEARNCLERGQHLGVFGLRKAGKSSLLNQLRATMRGQGWIVAQLDLNEFIGMPRLFKAAVVREVADAGLAAGFNLPQLRSTEERRGYDVVNESWLEDLGRLMKVFDRARGVVLIVDEIDTALPGRRFAEIDPSEESLGLLRALSQFRGFCQRLQARAESYPVLLTAGVNPALFERPQIRDAANPLYQFARLQFIEPLDREELGEMVRTLGKRTGMRFREAGLIDALEAEYGGHPLLTRQACSHVHQHRPRTVPYRVTTEDLEQAFAATGPGTALWHARDIPDSFAEWYPTEADRLQTVLRQSRPQAGLEHAVAYGLLRADGRVRMRALLRIEH